MKYFNRLTVILSLMLSSSLWAADLTVSAAASLTQAFQDIGAFPTSLMSAWHKGRVSMRAWGVGFKTNGTFR